MKGRMALAAMAGLLTTAQAMPPPPGGETTIRMSPAASTCLGPDVVQGREIVVLTTDGNAGGAIPYMLAGSQQPARLLTVTGGAGPDTVLVLSSSRPAVWDLRGVAKGRIKAVIADGYAQQGVIGLDADARTEFLARDSDAYASGCGGLPSQIRTLGDVPAFAKFVAKRFGRPPARLYGGTNPAAFNIDGGEARVPETVDVKAADIRASAPVATSDLLPGLDGMRQLIKQDAVRPFGPSDAQQWTQQGGTTTLVDGGGMMNPPDAVAPEIRAQMKRAMDMRLHRVPEGGFVLLKPVKTLPPGLNSAPFMAIVVPSGIPAPQNPGQSPGRAFSYYTLDGVPVDRLKQLPTEIPPIISRMDGERAPTPVTMNVAWKGSDMIVHLQGDDAPIVAGSAGAGPVDSCCQSAPRSRWPLVLMGVIVLAVLGLLGFIALRPKAGARSGRAARPARSPRQETPTDSTEFVGQFGALDGIVTHPPLKDALRTFRDEVSLLARRNDLDDDLAERCEHAVGDVFMPIASRYTRARPGADPATGREMDTALTKTIGELSTRLSDARVEQNRRNVAAMSGAPTGPAPAAE